MRPSFPAALAASLLAALPLAGKEETLIVLVDHKVSIDVPSGFEYSSSRDDRDVISVKITDPKQKIILSVSFLPDQEARLATESGQKDFLANAYVQYAEGSVENSYNFKDLAPRSGTGTYCVFTDSSLAGKKPLPPDEYLNITTGVKAWSDCFLVFSLLSNDTTSKEYQAALKMVRESFEEKNPPRPKSKA
jgi:hypothetical protein